MFRYLLIMLLSFSRLFFDDKRLFSLLWGIRKQARKDVLHWVLPRRNPLLAMEIETLQESHDLDADNIKFLKTLCDNDGNDQKLFWTTAWLLKPLVDWGSHVSNFLHGCPCRKPCVTDCPLKGRRAIEMACGRAPKFISMLKKIHVPKEAAKLLQDLPPSESSKLLTQWNAAKSCMELRVTQSFSLWQEKPWSLLRMGECLLDDAGELALHRSRAAAKEFLETPSPAKSMTVIEARFLDAKSNFPPAPPLDTILCDGHTLPTKHGLPNSYHQLRAGCHQWPRTNAAAPSASTSAERT